MNGVQTKRLMESVRKHPREAVRDFHHGLKEGIIQPERISLRKLYEASYGHGAMTLLESGVNANLIEKQRKLSAGLVEAGEDIRVFCTALSEAEGGLGAIMSTDFDKITSEIVINKVLQGYEDVAFIGDSLMELIPSVIRDRETTPGVSRIDVDNDGDLREVHEGHPFPHFGVVENYTESPVKKKTGFIVGVTVETILFDRTNEVLRRAQKVGETLGIDKEQRQLKVIMGITNNYRESISSALLALDTYYPYGVHPSWNARRSWYNNIDQALVDWRSIDAVERVFDDLRDPNTGKPILITPSTLLVMQARRHTAERILNSTDVRTDQTLERTHAGSTISNYSLMSSRMMAFLARKAGWTAEQSCWWLGDFKKAFGYWENWGLTVAEDRVIGSFDQDIAVRFKVSERGVAGVLDPRYVVKSCEGADASSSSGEGWT